jgi:hypothetical protein
MEDMRGWVSSSVSEEPPEAFDQGETGQLHLEPRRVPRRAG